MVDSRTEYGISYLSVPGDPDSRKTKGRLTLEQCESQFAEHYQDRPEFEAYLVQREINITAWVELY